MLNRIGEWDFSQRELNLLASVFVYLLVVSVYFIGIMQMPAGVGLLDNVVIKHCVRIALMAILVSIILFSWIHFLTEQAPRDERDIYIESKAGRVGMGLLTFGVIAIIFLIYQREAMNVWGWQVPIGLGWDMTPFLLVQTLIAVVSFSEILKMIYQLWLYRRG